jgi:hypothetical protein
VGLLQFHEKVHDHVLAANPLEKLDAFSIGVQGIACHVVDVHAGSSTKTQECCCLAHAPQASGNLLEAEEVCLLVFRQIK